MTNYAEDGSHHDAERSLVSRDGTVVRALASHQPARTVLSFESFRPGLGAKYWHGDVIQH